MITKARQSAGQTAEPAESQTDLFGEVIYAYTRAQAIADGVLVDAMQGEFGDVSRQHYRHPIAMTAAVFGLIERAVNNPDWCNDWAGVWHDILHMSRFAPTYHQWSTGRMFKVKITGVGRQKWHMFKIECGPGDNAEPVLTVMLEGED